MDNHKSLTLEHIKEMKHCIGLDYKKPMRGKYKAYRNYCMYTTEEEIWKHLVNIGYGKCYIENRENYIPPISYWYSLTQEGMDFLGSVLGCKIFEGE